MTRQAITSITDGQKKQYRRFVEDAAERALGEVGLDKDGLQRLISRGGEFQSRIIAGVKELSVSTPFRSWREQDGVIYFAVTSDGTTGEGWIKRLTIKGSRVGEYAKQVLCSSQFVPTIGLTIEIAVLKGMLFTDDDRVTKSIRAEADRRKLTKPNAEVACLIREKFRDQELEAMGFWGIVAMHEPLRDSDGRPSLLYADRRDGGRWLYAYCGKPDRGWSPERGFAFAVSQV